MQVTNLAFTRPDPAYWSELARAAQLAVLIDLDGTVIPFAATPEEAKLDDDAADMLDRLAGSGIHLAIVSGRPWSTLAPLVPRVPQIWWFAEHGAFWYRDGRWSGPEETACELDDLVLTIRAIASVPGARIERKSLSLCIHWRQVPAADRPGLVVAIEMACDEWLDTHPAFERLPGIEHLEVRRRGIDKRIAVHRMREHAPGVRIIAIGDDATDDDMFCELADGDAAIAVGPRATRARVDGALGGPNEVRAFLNWLVTCRTGAHPSVVPLAPIPELRPIRQRSLVVISSRTPLDIGDRHREVGGLVSALRPALRDNAGIWLGWSGHEREGRSRLVIDPLTRPASASFDLSHDLRERFYTGFCHRVLWPLFHGFPMSVTYEDDEWRAYLAANDLYADHAAEIALEDAPIWIHDYHLLTAGRSLRRRGHDGPIGLFLHTPFPTIEILEMMPWHRELLDSMVAFDLIGFHTDQWAANFLEAARELPNAEVWGDQIRCRGRTTTVVVFPIAIDHQAFADTRDEAADIAGLRKVIGTRRLLVGVDRLDCSTGIPQRLAGFERLLDAHPEWRGEISLVQVSVPSPADLPDYAELKHRVESIVGRINGRFGEADWVPVRYLYRAYDRPVLAQLYRLADVALVTPLRDGMNLAAKEFVASQDPARPGVLVLSRFAGAARELSDAILTNPLHPDGLAADIDRALRMPLDERLRRHGFLDAAVRSSSPSSWVSSFLRQLVPGTVRPLELVHHLGPRVIDPDPGN